MILAYLFLLDAFSLGVAAADTTCDDAYVVGTVWFRRKGTSIGDTDEARSYAGCKKGCYWNNYTTYNEYGSLKCLKCSEIKDEIVCKNNIATCQWTKGKCASQSCPGIAKARVSLNNASSAATFVENGTGVETRVENYMEQVKLAEECVAGSPKEQIFSQAYLDDFKTFANFGQERFFGSLPSCTSGINNCNFCQYPNGTACYNNRCGLNITLQNIVFPISPSLPGLCDDRLGGVTGCRMVPSINRDLCRWRAENFHSSTVYDGTGNTVCKPGTLYNGCLVDDSYIHDIHQQCLAAGIVVPCPGTTNVHPLLTNEDRLRLYGYRTIPEICQNKLNQELKACDVAYENAVGASGCYSGVAPYAVAEVNKTHNRIETMAQREACHQIYGCMYSASKGRCSVWAVWAFVLALVLPIVLVLVILAVVCFLLVRKLKSNSSKTSPVYPLDDTDSLLPAGKSKAAADPAGWYVLIKLGKQEKQTKKNANLAWGETVVFTDLRAEDDDVDVTLVEGSGTPVGTSSLRLTTFVGKKEHVSVAVSHGGAETGTIELDVEVVVKEAQQPPPLITATFVVSSGTKK